MPTLVDALVISLNLDTALFTAGQKKTVEELRKMQEESTRVAKEMELRGKQAADFFGQIKNQLIGLFAVFTAGSGLKQFATSIVQTDAAVGLLARNVGTSVENLTAWEGVARRSGAAASDVDTSFNTLANQFQQFAITGNSSVIPYFRALGISVADANGKMRPMNDLMLDLADKLHAMPAAEAQAFGQGLGLTPGMVNTLIQGRAALQALLTEQQALGHANAQDAASALALNNAWKGLSDASEDLGRKLLTGIAPALLKVLGALTQLAQWASEHREVVTAAFYGIGAAVVALSIALALPLLPMAALIAAIAAASAAIAYLAADWYAWTEGGQSQFAEFWQFFADKWAGIKDVVMPALESILEYWKQFFTTIGDGLKFIYTLFFGTSDDIRKAWSDLVDDLGGLFTKLVDMVKNIGPLLLDAFKSAFTGAFDWVGERWDAIWGAITGGSSAKKGTGYGPGQPNLPFTRPGAPGSAATGTAGGAKPPGGSSGAPAKPLTPGSAAAGQQDRDIQQLMQLGWTREQAIGLAANIQAESGGDHMAIGDGGKALGLGQWHPDRQADFQQWAGHGIRQSTHEEQIGFMDYELREGKERAAGAALRKTTTANEAASVVSKKYERPGDVEGEAAKRAALAQQIASQPGPAAQTAQLAAAPTRVAAATTGAGNTSTSTTEVKIGEVNVNAPNATDSDGVAKGIGQSMKKYSFLPQANSGLN